MGDRILIKDLHRNPHISLNSYRIERKLTLIMLYSNKKVPDQFRCLKIQRSPVEHEIKLIQSTSFDRKSTY